MNRLARVFAVTAAVAGLALVAILPACSSAPPAPKAAHSGYNPSPPNDPQDSLTQNPNKAPAKPAVAAPCSGYNVATGKCAAAAKAQADTSCPFGYIIAYGECVPSKQAAKNSTVSTTVAVPLDLTRWSHPSDRFYHDNVAAGQPITCNGRDSTGTMLVAISRADGTYIDQGSSCLHVGQDVVTRWLFLDDSIGKANPGWSQKQIQDAIAGAR